MNNIKLRIGPEKLEVNTEELDSVSIDYVIKDITNYCARNSSSTRSITILHTPNTDRIFQSLLNINVVNGYDVAAKIYAEILENDIIVLKGSLQVESITEYGYNVIIATNNVTLFNEMGQNLICDNIDPSTGDVWFDPSEGFHVWSRDHIRNMFNGDVSDNGFGYTYPAIDFNGNLNSLTDFSKNYQMLPSLYVRQLFNKTLAKYGYTYEISEDVSILMNKLVIPYNRPLSEKASTYPTMKLYFSENDVANYNTNYYPNWPNTTPAIPTCATSTIWGEDASWSGPPALVWDVEKSQRPPEYYNLVKGYRIKADGYDHIYNYPSGTKTGIYLQPIKISGIYSFDGSTNLHNTEFDMSVICNLLVYHDSSTIDTYSLGTVDLSSNGYGNLHLQADNIYLKETDQIAISFNSGYNINDYLISIHTDWPDPSGYIPTHRYYSSQGNVTPQLYYDCSLSFIEIKLQNTLVDGNTTFELNDLRPANYKQSDFVNDIFKIFNFYVEIDDKNPKNLKLKTYDEYYANSTIWDWSKKIIDDTIEFQPTKNYFDKKTRYQFSEDADSYTTDFKIRSGDVLNTKIIDNNSEFVTEERQVTLSIAPTAVKTIDNIYDIDVPTIISGKYDFKTDWKPRILFSQTWDAAFTYGYEIDKTLTCTKFHSLSPFYNYFDDTDNLFLGFETLYTYSKRSNTANTTLYNKYYKAELQQALDNRCYLLKAKAILNNVDVNTVKFSDIIYIKNSRIGNSKYHLNSIKNYTPNNKYCDIELIKLFDYTNTYDSSIDTLQIDRINISDSEAQAGVVSGSSISSPPSITQSTVDLSDYYKKQDVDAKIAAVNTSTGATYAYVDGSLALRDASIDKLFASGAIPYGNDGEIQLNQGGAFWATSAFNWSETYQRFNVTGDASIAGTIYSPQTFGNYIPNVSIGSGLYWSGGLLNASAGTSGTGTGTITGTGTATRVAVFAGNSSINSFAGLTYETSTGLSATKGSNVTAQFFGMFGGNKAYDVQTTTTLGYGAGWDVSTGSGNTFLGYYAGRYSTGGGANNTFIGANAGWANKTGYQNVYIGPLAGYNNISGYNNIFIGYNAGQDDTSTNKLYIHPSSTTQPLIYGEFDSSLLKVNGRLTVTGDVSCRNTIDISTVLADIDITNMVHIDGSENITGYKTFTPGLLSIGQIDASGGIIVRNGITSQLSTTTNNEYFGLGAGVGASGQYNTVLGQYAIGNGVPSSALYNVAIGYKALNSSTGGGTSLQKNVIIGYEAGLRSMSARNTFIGYQCGRNSSSGEANVFIGHAAGADEYGNNKLYIANTSTNQPLIYGEFDTSILRINGKLNITNDVSCARDYYSRGVIIVDKNYVDGSINARTIPTLTAGSIMFSNGTATISQDNTNLFWDNTYKRVGLGTIVPSYNLSFGFSANKTIGVETTLNTVSGKSLTISAGSTTRDSSVVFVPIGGTSRAWGSMTVNLANNDVYAGLWSGSIYKQTAGSGTFNDLVQPTKAWSGLAYAPDGSIYATVSAASGQIYKCRPDVSVNFIDTFQTGRNWVGAVAAPDGSIYAFAYAGEAYRCNPEVSTNFIRFNNDASRNYRAATRDLAGNIYAAVYSGDIYKCTPSSSDGFVALGQTSRQWYAMTYDANGNVYASTNGGDIYKQALGTGDFLPTNQTSRVWGAMAANTVTGNIYAGVTAPGDIYIYNNTSGTADLSGGDLILNSGTGKGTGTSNISFKTGTTLTTGTTLQTLSEKMIITGSGNVGIGTSAPGYTLDVSGNIHSSEYMSVHKSKHAYGGFDYENQSISLTVNTWAKITNVDGSLWTSNEYDGFSLVNDTMSITNPADYFGTLSITFSGNNTNDYEFRLYDASTTLKVGYVQTGTATGPSNFANISLPLYIEHEAGHTYEMQVRNITGSNACIMKSAQFILKYLHD